MAEQIVSSVLTKLGELLIKEYFFLKGAKQQVDSVKIQLRLMRSFLRDAEEKSKGDNRTRQWVSDVRDVALEIENAIDTYVVDSHNVRGKHVPLWKRCILTPAEWVALHKLGNKISVIQTTIKTITESKNNLGIQNLGEGVAEEKPLLPNLVVPGIDNEEIVGFEVVRKQIITALVDGASTQRRRVISIVGPGGLGKTTLAKKVFNNIEVKDYFKPCVWLTISKDFKKTDVLKKFYEEVTSDKRNEVEELQVYLQKLHNHLREKRYLIILDDVWSGDVLEWLNYGLPADRKDSRIIITTRSLDVARRADYSSVFELPLLTQKESLDLLLKNVIQNSDPLVNYPVEVVTNLANRCRGLPLAIVVLGRLMSTKPPAQWYKLEKNLDWYRDGENCMNILATSYHYLPYHLKSCFRYLACFPEDHVIYAESLLKMWVAEGFMACHGEGTLEDEAERCLEELAQRSLVQVIKRGKWDGSIRTIRVHDLLRELAMHEARENDYLLTFPNQSTQTDFNKARRIVIYNHNNVISESEKTPKLAMPNVRSFINFDREFPVEITYPLLRVLELEGSRNLTKLPKEFKSMIHLRYLGLESTNLKHLPKTIGCLQNLQTLNIFDTEIKQIPNSLWKIQSLRHVFGDELNGPPPSANLVNLQTLRDIYVPKSWKDGLPCLPILRILSAAINRSSVIQDQDIIIITLLLGTLNNLVSLTLFGFNYDDHLLYTRFPLDAVEMRQMLIELELHYFSFDKDPMPNLEKLPCLKSLELWQIANVEETICSARGFPQLEYLLIDGWHDLKHWKVEENSMPLLKKLNLFGCENLSTLPDLKHVKTLQDITIGAVSDVLQNKLQTRAGEEWQKIQHIPTIDLE